MNRAAFITYCHSVATSGGRFQRRFQSSFESVYVTTSETEHMQIILVAYTFESNLNLGTQMPG